MSDEQPADRTPRAGGDTGGDDAQQAATVGVTIAFVTSLVGLAAFLAVYATSADTQAMGGALVLALGGFGAGLVMWAHGLMPRGPHVERRKRISSDADARRRVAESFYGGGKAVERRTFLGRLLAGVAGATGLASLVPFLSLGPDPFPERLRTGWTAGSRVVDANDNPIRVDQLAFDSVVTVFPQGRVRDADSQAMLLRIRPEDLELEPERRGWTPGGNIVYSKVCTHAGCPVALYQTQTQRLLCPCHQSAFDVLDAARPIFGPATRPLPQLPLAVDDDGFLVARSDFPVPIGPGFWTLPGAGS